jgi:hypothetical protein
MRSDTLWGSRRNTAKHRWGHLTLDREYREDVMKVNKLTGEEYVADSEGPVMWDLSCDCGHEFTIPLKSFPGRHAMRSCGRDECPHAMKSERKRNRPKAPRGRPAKASDGRGQTIYMGAAFRASLEAYAKRKGLTLSAAMVNLAEAALERALLEEE